MAGILSSDPQQFRYKASDTASTGSAYGQNQYKGAETASYIDSNIQQFAGNAANFLSGKPAGQSQTQNKLGKATSGFDMFTSALNFIPGGALASTILQGANWLGGKLAKPADRIASSERVGNKSMFSGLNSQIGQQGMDTAAYTKAGGFAKMFGGKGGLDAYTNKLKGFQRAAAGIVDTTDRQMAALGNTATNIGTKNKIDFMGGPLAVPVGKHGLNTTFLTEFRKFKSGGKMEPAVNVIVDGKLHKELHHMGGDLDIDITRKGVPVVAMEDGGAIDQTAEVERDEIILHLQLTRKLEELEKDGSEEAMIEAGKILAKEILKNTKDSKSKLLKTVQ